MVGDVVSLNRFKKTTTIAIAIGILFLFIGIFLLKTSSDELDQTIYLLLSEELDVDYTVNKIKVSGSFIDIGAEWGVTLAEGSKILAGEVKGFQIADKSDLDYFKKVVRKNLHVQNDLEDYMLYRAEMPLGKDTICETKPCNIYILRKTGEKEVFIGVYIN